MKKSLFLLLSVLAIVSCTQEEPRPFDGTITNEQQKEVQSLVKIIYSLCDKSDEEVYEVIRQNGYTLGGDSLMENVDLRLNNDNSFVSLTTDNQQIQIVASRDYSAYRCTLHAFSNGQSTICVTELESDNSSEAPVIARVSGFITPTDTLNLYGMTYASVDELYQLAHRHVVLWSYCLEDKCIPNYINAGYTYIPSMSQMYASFDKNQYNALLDAIHQDGLCRFYIDFVFKNCADKIDIKAQTWTLEPLCINLMRQSVTFTDL